MFTETHLLVFCQEKLRIGEPNGITDASWAILSTCCVARTNDLYSAKISNFTVSLRHSSSGRYRITFTHERQNASSINETLICNIENELYVRILKAHLSFFDDVTGDPCIWMKQHMAASGIQKLIPLSRLELSNVASNIALELGIQTHRSYKQYAFRHLGFRRLSAMHICTIILMRIGNWNHSTPVVDPTISRSSARLANAPIVLVFK